MTRWLLFRRMSGRAYRHLTKDGKLVVLENQYIVGKGLDPADNEYSLQEEPDNENLDEVKRGIKGTDKDFSQLGADEIQKAEDKRDE